MPLLVRFLHDDEGQDLTEYGLLASLLSIAAVLTIRQIGPLVDNLFVLVQSKLPGAGS